MALLEVFIGLFFVYVLLSLFASIIQELVSGIVSLRGRTLLQALSKLLEFDDPRERMLLKRYLRHQNTSYKKLVSSNIGIRRLPSYLSRDQLIAIIQELSTIRSSLIKKENERLIINNQREKVSIESDNILKKLKIGSKYQPEKIEIRRKSLEKTISYKEDFRSYINQYKKDPKILQVNSQINEALTPRSVEIRPFDIFPWRWIYFKLYEGIVDLFRRKKKNQEFIIGNLPVIEYRMKNIQQKRLKEALEVINKYSLPDHHVSETLYAESKNDLFELYDDFMNRARGWFKRKVQLYLIFIGFLIAFYSNGDTIEIFNTLSTNPLARQEVVSMAEKFVENNSIDKYQFATTDQDSINIDSIHSTLNQLMKDQLSGVNSALGLSWDTKIIGFDSIVESGKYDSSYFASFLMPFDLAGCIRKETKNHPFKWIGFLLTALAISLGANFWFDLLRRLINIRNAGVRPESLAQYSGPQSHSHVSQGPIVFNKGKVTSQSNRIVG